MYKLTNLIENYGIFWQLVEERCYGLGPDEILKVSNERILEIEKLMKRLFTRIKNDLPLLG